MVHPTEHIRGSVSKYLEDKCIMLGLTGSVAVYKAIDTARWLIRRGARVIPILSKHALELVSKKLLMWATGEVPIIRLTGEVEHVDLAEECDLMLIAPATLSTLSKIAWGITDTPVTLATVSFMGMKKPVVVVPAMHYNMMTTLQYEQTLAQLKRLGIVVIPPYVAEGVAKYPDPNTVARLVASIVLRGRDLEGTRFLVTAGASREWFDPVRFISNPSSGIMGLEVALEAYARGAEVHFVHGNVSFGPPHFFKNYSCDTTEEFAEVVRRLTSEETYDVIVSAAALADFRPEIRLGRKIESGRTLEIKLVPTPKVLKNIVRRPKVLVAFAAETSESFEELKARALEKLSKYDADIVVANFVGRSTSGFSSPYLEGLIVSRGSKYIKKIEKMLKEEVARIVVDEVLNLLKGERIDEDNL